MSPATLTRPRQAATLTTQDRPVTERPRTADVVLPCASESVPAARRWLRNILTSWLISSDPFDNAVLILSELVTNVVQHAAGADHIEICAALWDGRLRISVADPDPTPPRVLPVRRGVQHGRGLRIVNELAKQWGHTPAPIGKVTFADLDVWSAS